MCGDYRLGCSFEQGHRFQRGCGLKSGVGPLTDRASKGVWPKVRGGASDGKGFQGGVA